MNRRRLGMLIKKIEQQPDEKFKMEYWFRPTKRGLTDYLAKDPRHDLLDLLHEDNLRDAKHRWNAHGCNTAACIAGTAQLFWAKGADTKETASVFAQNWLDITDIEANFIFQGNWSVKLLKEITKEEALEYLRLVHKRKKVFYKKRSDKWRDLNVVNYPEGTV